MVGKLFKPFGPNIKKYSGYIKVKDRYEKNFLKGISKQTKKKGK